MTYSHAIPVRWPLAGLTRPLVALLVLFSLGFTSAAQAAPPAKSNAMRSVQGVVNLNTATEAQLTLLPRIGPGKATRIVAYRQKRPFKRVTHLARVKGIGLKTVRLLKPYLTLTGPTTLTQKVTTTGRR